MSWVVPHGVDNLARGGRLQPLVDGRNLPGRENAVQISAVVDVDLKNKSPKDFLYLKARTHEQKGSLTNWIKQFFFSFILIVFCSLFDNQISKQ